MPEHKLSIVIPVYNSEKIIGELVEQLESQLQARLEFDIILVNDGSRDQSFKVLLGLSKKYDNLCVLNLSKNFGQHNATIAGLNYAKGEYVITMDDDLQHPAAEIFKLIGEIEKGYDVVYGGYAKHDGLFRKAGSMANDLMMDIMIDKPRELKFSSFRIIRSFVVKEMVKYDAPYPYLDGLILRITRNIGTITVEHRERKIGISNYTVKKLLSLWLNGFLNFSILPLRLFAYIGIVFAIAGFLSAVVIMVRAIFFFVPVQGWASLIVSTLIFSGVQLLSLGMVGEYVGRIYLTQNRTPQYVIREFVYRGISNKDDIAMEEDPIMIKRL
jgi:glycosyltransferase involved in cell wall biosynthesis